MKQFLFSVILLFTATLLFAQKDSIKVVSHWKSTDIRGYKVTKINSRNNDTGRMITDTASYTFRFVVLDSTANGYRIKWDFDDSPLYDELNEDEYEILTNQVGDLQLIYTTDPKGAFQHIENWQDISRYFNIYYDTKYAEDIDKDSTRVIGAYKKVKEAISTREGVEEQLFNEMLFFHLPFGHGLPIHDTLNFQDQRLVAYTDETAAANIKYFFSDVDTQKNEAVFNKVTIEDTDEAKTKLRTILQKYIDTMPVKTKTEKQEKGDAAKALSNINYSSSEQYTFKFNYKTGLPSKIYFKQAEDIDLKVEHHITVREIIIEEAN